MNLEKSNIKNSILKAKNWTLFLDRDGVINRRINNDYVKKVEEFEFLEGVVECLVYCSKIFQRIIVVTNQQGIGKGLMSEDDLNKVHNFMLSEIHKSGGQIDQVYFSPFLESDKSNSRKPAIGMASKAKHDFPEIDFSRSIMVGDSFSDMMFGKNAGMFTVFTIPELLDENIGQYTDIVVDGLKSFREWLTKP
jgi:histidinol-phosphate phosphatase family protein